MIIKTEELYQSNNDVYFLKVVSDKIIINDNYAGLLILNKELNVIKNIIFPEEITIYSSFMNDDTEEILLYCPDNNCMIYLELKNYKYKIIELRSGIENMIFSREHNWEKNHVILSSSNSEFVRVDITTGRIEEIKSDKIEDLSPNLYNRTRDSITKEGNISINLSENKMEVFWGGSSEVLYPENDFIFLDYKVMSDIENSSLIVLCSDKSDVTHSKIICYKII